MKKSDDSKKIRKEIEKELEKDVKVSNDTKKSDDIEEIVDKKVSKKEENIEEDNAPEFKNLRIELEDEELKEGETREKIISEEEIMANMRKMGFFKRLVLSIKDFDNYIEVAMLKISNTFTYMLKLLLLCAIIIGVVTSITNVKQMKSDPDKIIKQIEEVKQTYGVEVDMGRINVFIHDTSELKMNVYLGIPLIIALYLVFIVTTLLNMLLITVLGYLISRVMKIPLKFGAVFNMSASAVTLPVILNLIYTIVTQFSEFRIQHFDLMYDLIANVYMIVAIMYIRAEIIKKNVEGEKAK